MYLHYYQRRRCERLLFFWLTDSRDIIAFLNRVRLSWAWWHLSIVKVKPLTVKRGSFSRSRFFTLASFHPQNTKLAYFFSLFHRAIQLQQLQESLRVGTSSSSIVPLSTTTEQQGWKMSRVMSTKITSLTKMSVDACTSTFVFMWGLLHLLCITT